MLMHLHAGLTNTQSDTHPNEILLITDLSKEVEFSITEIKILQNQTEYYIMYCIE